MADESSSRCREGNSRAVEAIDWAARMYKDIVLLPPGQGRLTDTE